jgi:copper(I)-binding protein
MKARVVLPAVAAILITAVAVISFARGAEAGIDDILVVEAWVRATPPGATVAAAYVTLANRTGSDDCLQSAATPTAEKIEVHESIEEGGVAKMRPLEDVIVPASGTLEMHPGGVHMMLMGLSEPLEEGEILPLILVFENAGEMTVQVEVTPIGAHGPTELYHTN